ncbi:MAG: helicase-related protein [Thermacetogeniaceae bacterium]|jgi:competence protein ComFA|nr:helicase-related protein [Thermoanaerobacterales bacterium]NLN21676.1 DEAD/DEAH box helicase family protein [Syntrophomonadaceae bacterium]HAF17329.1 hypothetical protein [Peptococcaceae bacterium]
MEYITIMLSSEQRLLFQLYAAQGRGKFLFFLSPVPLFDFNYLAGKEFDLFFPVVSPLPLGLAASIFKDLCGTNFKKGSPKLLLEKIRNLCSRELGRRGLPAAQEEVAVIPAAEIVYPPDTLPGYEELHELESLLKGRLLSLGEIQSVVGFWGKEILAQALQLLCLEGKTALLPALYRKKGSLVYCQRCGWEGIPDTHNCARCGSSECCSCPDCGLLGSLSFCDPLYTGVDDNGGDEICCKPLLMGASLSKTAPLRKAPAPRPCRWTLPGDIKFTPPQEAAAQHLLKFGREGKPGGTCLVWAACGAGKTEVSFPLIAEMLNQGKKVLFASPRRDVVLEIAPRLALAFGRERTAALYGGSSTPKKEFPLLAATTHQVLRFYHNFDLVILDEGDAYPFPESRMLHYGVEKARCSGGKLVYLTATPTSWMLAQARKSRVDIIKIPARPHGFPLPVPKFLKIAPLQKTRMGYELQRQVLEIAAELLKKAGSRIFLFVPSVALTSLVGEALRSAAGSYPLEHLKPDSVQWTHAGDRDRKLKRERFFAGEFPLLVTTTIMERGVTVPRVNVLVLEAAQEGIFDTSTLVQIAGRCGRSPDYPTGEVWFISREISRSMREARLQIMGMNKEAQRKGYLRGDWEEMLGRIVF